MLSASLNKTFPSFLLHEKIKTKALNLNLFNDAWLLVISGSLIVIDHIPAIMKIISMIFIFCIKNVEFLVVKLLT